MPASSPAAKASPDEETRLGIPVLSHEECLTGLMVKGATLSGRLVVSIPTNAGALPYYYNHKLKSGGTPLAYHFGSKYCFGYGLSYTRFAYRELKIPQDRVKLKGRVEVACLSIKPCYRLAWEGCSEFR